MPKIALLNKKEEITGYSNVDEDEIEWLECYKWILAKNGYAYTIIGGRMISMHRMINQPREGLVVDHINRDRLDNRKSNLRNVTRGENGRNTSRCKPETVAKSLSITIAELEHITFTKSNNQIAGRMYNIRTSKLLRKRIDRAADNMDCSTAALVRGMIEYVLNHPEILDRVRPISRVTTRSRDIAEVV